MIPAFICFMVLVCTAAAIWISYGLSMLLSRKPQPKPLPKKLVLIVPEPPPPPEKVVVVYRTTAIRRGPAPY